MDGSDNKPENEDLFGTNALEMEIFDGADSIIKLRQSISKEKEVERLRGPNYKSKGDLREYANALREKSIKLY